MRIGDSGVPYFVIRAGIKMITEAKVRELIEGKVEADGYFIVEVSVSAGNDIRIVVDSENGVPISYCEEIDALVETSLNRDEEDYSLEVSSAGIGTELKVMGQFMKNIGNKVEVTMPNGAWVRGVLVSADEEGFEIETEEKRKVETESGKKVNQIVKETHRYERKDIRSVKDIVEF